MTVSGVFPRVRLAARLLGLLAVILTACQPVAAPGASAQPGTPAASAPGGPRRGGTFVGVIAADPQTANLDTTTDINSLYAFSGVFSALVAIDEKMHAVPELAESWSMSPDGKRYEFKLHQNVRFHDGTPLTSEDVRFSAEEVAGKYHALTSSLLKGVKIETPDANTVAFMLPEPSAVFLLSLGIANLIVLPKARYAGSDPRENPVNRAPIGSGPFKFKEWVKGDHVTLERNGSYYKPGQPYFDVFTTRVVPDAGARTIAFQKGDIDFLPGQLLAREQLPELRKLPGIQVNEKGGAPGEELLFFNLKRKPLDDVRVREAIVRAIDQKAVAERAFFGAGINVATSHIEQGITDFFDASVRLPAYDVARAKQLLDEAGLRPGSDGIRVRLRSVFSPSNDGDRRSAEVVKDALKDVGIAIELMPMDNAQITKAVFTDGDYDLFNASVTSKGDPEIGIKRHYVSSSIGVSFGNGSRYVNPEIDQLFAVGGSASEVAKRRDAYVKIQAILARDLPTFPLIDYWNIDLARPELGGVFLTPFYYYRPEVLFRKQ